MMAELPIPSWFKYLQGTAEPAAENCYRLMTPLIAESFIRIQQENGLWFALVADSAAGPAIRKTEPTFANENDAWQAAFELYRAVKVY
jgi:hypothetical protein